MSGALSHNPSQIVRQLLIDLALASDGGASWPVYATQEANSPDATITVYDTAGRLQGKVLPIKEVHILRGVQINIRASDATTGYKKADDIAIALDQVALSTVNVTDPSGYGTATQAYTIYNIARAGDIIPVPQPSSNLKVYTVNVLVNLKQS